MRKRAAGWVVTLLILTLEGMVSHSLAGLQFTTIDEPNAVVGPDQGTMPAGISGTNVCGSYYNNGNNYYVQSGTSFTTLADPSAIPGTTVANGVDGDNVVGYYSAFQYVNGFEYSITTGSYTTFDVGNGESTFAYGISGTDIVGSTYTNGPYQGFELSGTNITYFDGPGTPGFFIVANGISGDEIAGYYLVGRGTYRGFVGEGTTYEILDDPSASTSDDPAEDPSGVAGTEARGVEGNTVVGFYVDKNGMDHGFLAQSGTYTTIDEPDGADGTVITCISGSTIAGFYYDINQGAHGFMATGVTGITSGTYMGGGGGAGGSNYGSQYTLLLSATNPGGTIPVGTGYATLKVSKKGGVIMGGRLPDGTSVSVTGSESASSPVSFTFNKAILYPGTTPKGAKGSLGGTLTFVSTGTSAVSGTLEWTKPGQKTGDYRAAIETGLAATGSLYVPPAKGGSVLPGFAIGTVELTDTTGYTLDKDITLTAKDKVTVTDAGPDKLSLEITPGSGMFKGTVHYPDGKKSISVPVDGVVFQEGANGAGLFLGPNGTGNVTISPTP